ncbi:tetratricopeptide repeat protein [Spirosoma sp. BT702]|uniref:histidine kinase n=1 Tax=Spirosoma profusum TaxID=2771354 RepID=A0A926XX74_9BACT|nr:tetratricopeptide repeat protein [Spirosoma profusum]MBD2699542.1 tetratricopeptide repeat protein [Spirosoma profusum]
MIFSKSLLFLLLFLSTGLSAVAQSGKIDSLEHVLRHQVADTNRVKTLAKTAEMYWTSNPPKSKQYAEEAITLGKKLDYALGIGMGYTNLGIYYWSQGKYPEAIGHFKSGILNYEKANYLKGIAGCYNNLGMCSRSAGDFSQAISYYFKALKIYEKLATDKGQAQIYNNIGLVFKHQEKYDQALYYYQQSLRKSTGKDSLNQAGTLDNIGGIYLLKKDYPKATQYLNQSRVLFLKLKEPMGVAICNNDLGKTYMAMNQYARAEMYFQQALLAGQKLGHNTGVLTSLLGLGEVRLKTGRAVESLDFFNKASSLADQSKQQDARLRIYNGLASAYSQTGNFAQAYQFQSKWTVLKDSMFNETSAKKIARVQAEYQAEKKQIEIEGLKKDNEQSAFTRNISIVGLLGILLIAGLVVSRQRLKIRNDRLLVQKSAAIADKNQLLAEQASQLTAANEQLKEQSAEVARTNEQLEKQAVELAQKSEQLQQLDQAKSHFFANISHEFRTPLTLILGTLQDKLNQNPNAPSAEFAVMHRNASRLLELINQLLDLSKLESGRLKLEARPGDMGQFFRIIMSSFGSQAEYRRITFDLSMPETGLYYLFDADKLEKITSNLLSNAFKHTPDGGRIRLLVDTLPETSSIRISVQDSGPGLAIDQLDKVFDRFYQGSRQYSDQQGSGIGLALTKELVELHGGQISVESQLGHGARFVVELPLSQCSAAVIPSADVSIPILIKLSRFTNVAPDDVTPCQAATDTKKPLLLIVEDNPDLRTYIRQHLQNQYRVIERENGRLGLEAAQAEIPDVVISDLMMPEMDGLELCHHLKTDERTSHIPVILLTALATQESKLQGLETGADDYLTKPFDARELLLRVSNLLEMRRRMRERFGREIRLQPNDVNVTSTDEKFLQRIMIVAEAHLSDSLFGPEEFSREVGMSRMQLHRKLTAITGQTTTEFLRTLRLKRAAQLLEAQAGNVSEVAFTVGFEHLSYFAKSFREQFGVSASEYVEQLSVKS